LLENLEPVQGFCVKNKMLYPLELVKILKLLELKYIALVVKIYILQKKSLQMLMVLTLVHHSLICF